MEKFELIAPCHFGMEAVLKREILDLGYEITKVEDGKVTFEADAQGIADANIFLFNLIDVHADLVHFLILFFQRSDICVGDVAVDCHLTKISSHVLGF